MIGPVPLTDKHRRQIEEFRVKHRTGVLTLLFSDMVESTRAKQELGDAVGTQLIQRQQETVRAVLARFPDAQEISTAGDSFFIVFSRPSDAVRFALQLHAGLRAVSAETPRPLLVRVGIHMGEVFIQEKQEAGAMDVLGLQVDTASRVMSLASGGQVLMTRSVFDNSRAVLRGEEMAGIGGISWLEHGAYRFKGVDHPYGICEVGEEGLAPLAPPPDSEKVRRVVSADEEPVLGWRPAVGQEIPTAAGWIVEEKLGEGGFGEVWKARHKTMKEARVFKFCFRADRVRSLKREVTLFRLLRERMGEHPNIVRLYDVFFDEPPYYIVMEAVDGRDLSHWWEDKRARERLPMQTRLEIVAQVADALAAAHDAGVIHRDVKPSNVLISYRNNVEIQVKLTDFGIGQVVSDELLAGRTAAGFTQTFMGSEMSSRSGTQLYMAPEVVAGRPASTRSDIYSLGVVLYQLVTGDLGRSLAPDWRKDVADPLLADLMAPCFAGNPEERYAGAAELASKLRSLEQIRADLAESARQAEAAAARRRLARFLAASTGVFLLVALALALGWMRESAQRARADANRARAEDLTEFMLFDLHAKLREIGRLDLLEEVARKSLEYYTELPEQSEAVEAQLKRAATFINIGDVFLHKGRAGDALSAYSLAHGILARLAEEAEGLLSAQRNLYMIHYRLGQAQLFAARPDEAFAAFSAGIQILEGMLEAAPDEPSTRQELVSLLTYYSESLNDYGRVDEAGEAIGRARELTAALLEEAPDEPERLRQQLFVERHLGALAFDRGLLRRAYEHYQNAEAAGRRLVAHNPEHSDWQNDLAACQGRLTDVLIQQGRSAEARQQNDQVCARLELLCNRDPLNIVWKKALLSGERRKGILFLNRWEIEEASRCFSGALALADELLRRAGDNPAFLSERALTRLRAARVAIARGQLEAALAESRAARQTLRDLSAERPGQPLLEWREATTGLGVGDLLLRLGETEAASREVEHALRAIARLRGRLAENVFLRGDEAAALRSRGDVARKRGDLEVAFSDYTRARALSQELAGIDASNVAFQVQFARLDLLLARTEMLLGRASGTRERLLGVLERMRPLLEAGDDPLLLDTWSQALLLLDEIAEARPTVQRLLAMGWNDPNFLEVCRQTGLAQEPSLH